MKPPELEKLTAFGKDLYWAFIQKKQQLPVFSGKEENPTCHSI